MTSRTIRGGLLVASGLALVLAAGAEPTGAQDAHKSIFVSALDSSGRPVTDLTADDFAIREDGVDRQVVGATLTTEPLNVALLADTTAAAERYVYNIRAGLKAFVQDLLAASPRSEISLWEFGQTSRRIRPFTSDAAALEKDVARLSSRSQAGSALLDAVHDASEAFAKRQGPRRVIVVLNSEPNDEQSRRRPKTINDALIRSRAQLWSLTVQTAMARQHDFLLDPLVRNAGGLREFVLTDAAIDMQMRRYAAALTAQYELTYRRPPGPAQIVQTGVRRDGVKLVTGIVAPH
jgi:VWFA-related protein